MSFINRNGTIWTIEEDDKLTKEYSQFINKMALAHNRSIKAILYRLNNYEQPVKLVPIVPVVPVENRPQEVVIDNYHPLLI